MAKVRESYNFSGPILLTFQSGEILFWTSILTFHIIANDIRCHVCNEHYNQEYCKLDYDADRLGMLTDCNTPDTERDVCAQTIIGSTTSMSYDQLICVDDYIYIYNNDNNRILDMY